MWTCICTCICQGNLKGIIRLISSVLPANVLTCCMPNQIANPKNLFMTQYFFRQDFMLEQSMQLTYNLQNFNSVEVCCKLKINEENKFKMFIFSLLHSTSPIFLSTLRFKCRALDMLSAHLTLNYIDQAWYRALNYQLYFL